MYNHKITRFITIFLALSLGISAGIVSYTQILNVPDQAMTNWYYDHAVVKSLDNRITVIAIDEKSEQQYGSYSTWSRMMLANAVRELSEQNAAVIGLDVDLSKESPDTNGDESLVDACADAGNVIAMANVLYDTPTADSHKEGSDNNTNAAPKNAVPETSDNAAAVPSDFKAQEITDISYPYEALLSQVSIGIANATQESSDGFIRNAALTIQYEDSTYDSFATAIYKAFQDSLGEAYTLPELNQEELFGFNALSGEINCNIISFSDLLQGSYDASLIDGNIILIGEYKENTISTFQHFVNPTQEQQETLVQASIIQSLLSQQTIAQVNPLIQAVCYSILITLCYLVIASRKIWVSILSSILLSQAVVGIGFLANTQGYRFQLLVPILFFIIALIVALMQRYSISIIERKKMERTLKLYVEPQVVDQLSEKSPFELVSFSERRHIAVLFVDIRGFTTISESLEPEQVVEILNEYLSLVATAIQHWEGTLDKFIGDAAMAIFNAPNDRKDYIFHAVCAAYEISKSADYLREKYEARYGKPVTFGIGINCGDAIVGNIGSYNRMDYTAIGDTVNTASRLEANAKAGQILISKAVLDAVGDRVDTTYIGSLALKGKTKTVETYQVDRILSLPDSAFQRKGILNDSFILHSKIRPLI